MDNNYWVKIWDARYFYTHLANAELKYKFRRSKLGMMWTMITPLVLALLMTFILGNLLGADMHDYAPYIYSGLLTWEFLLSSVIGGCNSLIVSEPYIKQYKHPFAIYPLKTTIVNLISFSIAIVGLMLWVLFLKPVNLLWALAALPFSLICLFFVGWPIAILTSFTNLKYRDFAQVAVLGMQLLWYLSPVFFRISMFKSPILAFWIELNPVTHILNLLRAPILYGTFPSVEDYAYVLGSAAFLSLVAIYRIKRSERDMIYYF